MFPLSHVGIDGQEDLHCIAEHTNRYQLSAISHNNHASVDPEILQYSTSVLEMYNSGTNFHIYSIYKINNYPLSIHCLIALCMPFL